MPQATASPVAAGAWADAGSMVVPRTNPHAALLPDGRVLVAGDETGWNRTEHFSPNGASAELWTPASGSWQPTASLPAPRNDYAMVSLADGRVAVVGGLSGESRSYSSVYVYDADGEAWSKSGLLGTARTAPGAATLADGRVLVAGGWYQDGPPNGPGAATARLAMARPAPGDGAGPVDDVDPPSFTAALATAEVFDPVRGTSVAAGRMRFARISPAMATLDDGRVLVVGSINGERRGVSSAERAAGTAEIWEPAAEAFRVTDPFPAVDWAAVPELGVAPPSGEGHMYDHGTLLALDDGDALLVGTRWFIGELVVTRSFRFSGTWGIWLEVGVPQVLWPVELEERVTWQAAGEDRANGTAARLPDGRVLAVGGTVNGAPAADVDVLDPAGNTWADGPSLPAAREGGALVVLGEGSALFAGGFVDGGDGDPWGLADAYRLTLAD